MWGSVLGCVKRCKEMRGVGGCGKVWREVWGERLGCGGDEGRCGGRCRESNKGRYEVRCGERYRYGDVERRGAVE